MANSAALWNPVALAGRQTVFVPDGAVGAYGYTETSGYYGGAAGGAAVVGNSYITWIANGTRNGSIS